MSINISTGSGIAFSAMPTNNLHIPNNKNATEETSKIEDKQYSYKTNSANGTLVEFRDPANGKNVSVSLNDNVLDKLKKHFSSEDFNKNDDGKLKLSGNAEKFVSGWFGDIAYTREFLSADQNQDGKLDSDEYLNTRNEYKHVGSVAFGNDTLSISGDITKNYQKVKDITTKQADRYNHNYKAPTSIDDELNTTLRLDKDFDSNIDIIESFRSDILKDNLNDEQTVLKNVKEDLVFQNTKIQKIFKPILEKALTQNGTTLSISKDENKEEELKKLEALMKLLMANGDVSKLSADERELLGSELQTYAKDVTDKLSSSLSSILDAKITTEINTKADILQTEDKKLKILEKLKQNDGDTLQLSKDEKELISTELEKVTNNDGNIDIDKLKQIQEYQKAKISYTEIDIQPSKLYVQKG